MALASKWTLAASAALLVPSLVLAQDDPRDSHDRSDIHIVGVPCRVKLDKLIGAKVSLQPDAADEARAQAKDKEAKRPDGEVKDFLVKRGDGHLCAAVVSVGGILGIGDKVVAVPFRTLTWQAKDERFTTNATEEQLKRLPEFDEKSAKEKGLDQAVATARDTWIAIWPDLKDDDPLAKTDNDPSLKDGLRSDAAREAAEREDTARVLLEGSTYRVRPVNFVLASELDDHEVDDLDGKFGKVKDVVVDCNNRRVDAMLVSHGGVAGIGDTLYVLPRESLLLCSKGSDDDSCRWCVPHRSTAMEQAVVWHAPSEGVLTDEQLHSARDWCAMQTKTELKNRETANANGH